MSPLLGTERRELLLSILGRAGVIRLDTAAEELGVVAEFERSMIVERVKAGLKRARAEGKVLGRPRVSADIEAKVIALRGKGEGMRKIARTLGIGNCTVQRIVNA